MNRDDILRMALECHLVNTDNLDGYYMKALERFAELAAAAEREPIGLTFAEVKDIIQSNITITDPKLFDAVYAVAVDIELAVLEKNAAGRANNEPR
jgi:hypothetical protein